MRTTPRLATALAVDLTAALRTVVAVTLTAAALTVVGSLPAAAQEDGRASVAGRDRLAARGTVVASSSPALPQIAAASWLVADLDTGQVLAAKDAHGQYAPASTLKALTAVTLIPELPAGRVVRASFDDVNVEGSRVGVVENVDYSVGELFAALLMVSGNDAANVLASTAGGQERTAELMNAKAAALGARDTHAVNPHGLDAPGQVSSAYDLALIARAGLDDPDFSRYVSTVSSSVNAPGGARIEIRNKNKLLGRYPGALGVKNGFTTAARASFIGAAERNGRRLVVTMMRADPRVFDEAVELLDWGFAAPSAAPVGRLVRPSREAAATAASEQLGAAPSGGGRGTSVGQRTGGATSSEASAGVTAQEATGLPVTLAGLGLAAAALMVVRVRPAAAAGRASGRRPGRAAGSAGRSPRSGSARSGGSRSDSPRSDSSRSDSARTSSPRPSSGRGPADRPPVPRRPVERHRAPRHDHPR